MNQAEAPPTLANKFLKTIYRRLKKELAPSYSPPATASASAQAQALEPDTPPHLSSTSQCYPCQNQSASIWLSNSPLNPDSRRQQQRQRAGQFHCNDPLARVCLPPLATPSATALLAMLIALTPTVAMSSYPPQSQTLISRPPLMLLTPDRTLLLAALWLNKKRTCAYWLLLNQSSPP